MEELKEKILEAKSLEELEEIKTQMAEQKVEEPIEEKVEELVVEEPVKEEPQEMSVEEERSLMANIEEKSEDISNLQVVYKGETKMEEKKFGIDSVEYRNAWAKRTMGLPESRFTEDEKRALGDAITTTATTFVQADADHNGINNGGLYVPTSLRLELTEHIEQMSPFFRDIRKLNVNGNIDLPYLFAGDDANWYTETTCTANEGQEYRNLQLTGWELAKDVVITWKLEEMSVESFISFIVEELVHKMGVALVNAVLYGDGSNKPTGVINGLTPVTTGETPIDNIIATYNSLSQEAKRGAKVYVSPSVKVAMIGYKDDNGNYPFLQGLNGTDLFSIETDPYLQNYDIVVGNPRYYILNENTPLRIDAERTVKCRQVRYGAYAIYDGKAKPGAFALGRYIGSQSL